MNIYYSSLYYKNNHVTGANKRFDEIGKRLLKKYPSEFICLVTDNNKPKWCPEDNCYTIRGYNSKFQRILTWLSYSILLSKLPRGILINDFMPLPVLYFKKHIHFQLIHDLRNFEEFKRGGLGYLTSTFQKWQLLKADKIITVSNYTANMINKFCGKDKIDIIVSYNGVDGALKSSSLSRTIDILYIATFEERKNHIKLLKGLELYKGKLNVVFIGSDLGLKDKVRSESVILSKKFGHQINFHEQISEDELRDVYLSSKVFCSPSLYEGFGMPIIEAFQHGCKVVCSDIDVFREVTLNHAHFFDPLSPEDICKALHLSLEQELNLLDLCSSKDIVEYFSWDKISERLCVEFEGFYRE